MAEAQEQPQAQPQPEPVFAAAEEPAHAHVHAPRHEEPQLLAQSPSQSLSQATWEQPEQEQQQEPQQRHEQNQDQDQDQDQDQGKELEARIQAELQAQLQAQASSEAESDAPQQTHSLIRSLSRSRSPNILPTDAATTELAVAPAHEQDLAPEQGAGQQVPRLQQNHAADTIHTDSTTPTDSPLAFPTTTVATDHITPPTTSADTNGGLPEQEHQQQNGASPSPSSATMSNNPSHPPGPPRQPVHYPNQTTYATPGINNAHYGYQNSGSQGSDAYRASASAANSAMALPSMRTFDSAQQQSQQQHMAMAMPVTPVPSVAGQQPLSYYGQQVAMGTMAGNPYGLPPEALAPRYPLPPTGPGNVLAGGRHKKCDEEHPICRNCQKSKRECLGYDPIFKNNQPHPSIIQPATNNQSSSSSSVPSNDPPSAASAAPSASASVSVSGHAQAATSYANLPAVISNTSPATASFSPGLGSAGNPGPYVKNETLEYPTTIDPALGNALNSSSMSTSHFPAIKSITPHLVDHRAPDLPHLRGGGPPFAPFYLSASHSSTPSPSQQRIPAYSGSPANKMKVDQLVSLGNVVPPALDSPLTQESLDEVKGLYDQVYAPGLKEFFETEWYIRPQGLNTLLSNSPVIETFAGFLQSMANMDANDLAGMQYSANLEFRIVWDLATLVYASEYKTNVGNRLPPPDDGSEARNRVAVLEALLAGDFLDQNPLLPPPENADGTEYQRCREFKFWYYLAEFLRVKDQHNLDMTHQRDLVLGQLRDTLDGRENRDVLYSFAIIRALSPNFPPDFESSLPPHLDESDPKSKLAVARKFIQDESQVTGGTTNVVRRFSELAVRAYITPGNNIARR